MGTESEGERMSDAVQIEGKDNYGKPRQDFADKVAAADDSEYLEIAERYIWLSAYASMRGGSDYHWKADLCYDEAKRRGEPDLYQLAWLRAGGKGK
jgi:hypothetical protein